MVVPANLANKFSQLDFTGIPGHPHLMPTFHEWNEYLPRFSGNADESMVEHLRSFHVCMEQQSIVHQDVTLEEISS